MYAQLGGLIDEAGDDVDLYMANTHEVAETALTSNDDDLSCSPQLLRPRSKRLKLKSLRGGEVSETGDKRRRDEYGYLMEGELRPSDLIPGFKLAKAKRGYVYTGQIIQASLPESSESSCGSTPSALQPILSLSANVDGMHWEAQFDDDPSKTILLTWDEARYDITFVNCLLFL
jgi:hypothetical protein